MWHVSKFALSMAGAIALVFTAQAEEFKGPSSSQTPYLVGVAPGVKLVSILTVGDAVRNARDGSAYRMVGIPDGLGAYRDKGKLVVVMNQELSATVGVVRAHGGKGAFVSRWTIDIDSLAVLSGEDQIRTVNLWDAVSKSYKASTSASFGRFCSADLPAQDALYNKRTRKGYAERMFMNGEESGNEGRAFAHIVTGPDAGTSYELPSLGKFSWENAVANPTAQDKTIVIGTDDSTPGQVYVYVGDKQRSGNPVERAGLHGGKLFGVKVAGLADESRAATIDAAFTLVDLGDVRDLSGTAIDALSVANSVTRFLRPEDGSWDTLDSAVFYFNTTDRYDQVKDSVGATVGTSRIHRLTFSDIRNPELGGTIRTVTSDTGPQQMLDNITVNAEGKLVVLEDVGGNPHNGKVWQVEPATGAFTLLARHDVARFGDLGIPATAPYTTDEESSGVIEVTRLVKSASWFDRHYRYYLLDVQAHYPNGAELVEGGQLLLMAVPGASKAPHDDDADDGESDDGQKGNNGHKD